MSRIFIGIPSIRKDQRFIDSMDKFIPEVKKSHEVIVMEARDMKIDDARNFLTDKFLDTGFEYLLFLDDDHEGHSIEMLEALFRPQVMVCAIKCYSRGNPHTVTLMNYSGLSDERLKYQENPTKSGYSRCDLVGFGMTLIKREAFGVITRPYFVCENNQKEDNYFCDKLVAKDLKPLGCFDYCLTHDGINESNAELLNEELIRTIRAQLPEEFVNKSLIIAG